MLRGLLVAILIALVAAVGLIARRLHADNAPVTGQAEFHIGSHRIIVDRAMVRNGDLRNGGAVNRLDLALSWPDFRGAMANPATPPEMVFVTLEQAVSNGQAGDFIDPADRPALLYSRFLEVEAWSNPGGLVMRRFRAGTPYDGEELYLSTPDERLFAARCPKQGSIDDFCLWQAKINGFDVQVRFQPKFLVHWQHLADSVRALTHRISAPAG